MARPIFVLAVLVGTGLGTAAALWRERAGRNEGAQPVTATHRETYAASAVPPSILAASAWVASNTSRRPSPEPDADLLSKDQLELARLHCSLGAPGDCLRVAHTLEQASAEKARRYRRIAVSLYLRECRARDPIACVALSRMYARGQLLERDPVQAGALITRAAMLCRMRPEPACATIAAETGAGGP